MNKVYEIAFERIKQALEQGIVPWHKPWKANGIVPSNLTTLKPYRGINVMYLSITRMLEGFKSPYWLTSRQAGMTGGRVKPEFWKKYTPVFFFKMLEAKDDPNKTFPILRFYQVYNLDQCEVPAQWIPADMSVKHLIDPINEAELIVERMPNKPPIEYGFDSAAYVPSKDRIILPEKESFDSAEEYYSTIFHELVHSTGHENRLNRKADSYAFEELVAEIGSGMLCNKADFQEKVIANQTAYISGWLQRLKENPAWLVQAAGKAQKASDYILNVQYEEKSEETAA